MAKKRTRGDVEIEFLEGGERCIVSGGALRDGLVWMPAKGQAIVEADGRDFLMLTVVDRGLQALCGCTLSTNAFLETLKDLRKDGVSLAINAILDQESDMCRASASKRKAERTRLLLEHPEKLPKTIKVQCVGAPDGNIEMITETDGRKNVAITLDSNVLNFVVSQIRNGIKGSDGKKRTKKVDRFPFKYPEVKMNSQRQVPMVSFLDADGKTRYHNGQLRDYDENVEGDYEAAMHECAELLHDFFCTEQLCTKCSINCRGSSTIRAAWKRG